MDLLANVPTWDEIERNLDNVFGALNQSVSQNWHSAYGEWDGFSRRVSADFDRTYGQLGGNRIAAVQQAIFQSYPLVQMSLKRRWASIEIDQILDVLLRLVRDVTLILGGSVAVGSIVGGVAGAFAFGAGAAPGVMVGAGIGMQVGNLILMGLGLSSIAEYFYNGLPSCLTTLQGGLATAWHSEDGSSSGLDPTGGSEGRRQLMVEQAALQLAKGQEQLVLLLLTAIVTYLMRGQIKAGITGNVKGIAARSANLQAEIKNKQLASWLAKNEQRLLALPELQVKSPFSKPRLVEDTPPRPSPLNETIARVDSKRLVPGTAEHKTARWEAYQERGGIKDQASWGRQYDTNMRNYQFGLSREVEYRTAMGASVGTLKTPLTNRQIDILMADELYAGQLKTGPVSLTKANVLAIQKDHQLIQRGWQVEHILEKGASKPYIEALDRAGIDYHLGPKIP